MALRVVHTFVSEKADGPDTTLVRPSDWNDEHALEATPGKILGSTSGGDGTVVEQPMAFDGSGNPTLENVTGYFRGALGTTAQRPTHAAGRQRFNVTLTKFEYSDGTEWRSIASESWVDARIAALADLQTGDLKVSMRPAVYHSGWIPCNDGTIGSAASGASTRANADTQALYTLLYNACDNSICPVTGGRSGDAATDFAANKPIALTKVLGRALVAAGAGAGLTNRVLGAPFGSDTNTASTAITNIQPVTGGGGENMVTPGVYTSAAFSIAQASTAVNVFIKL